MLTRFRKALDKREEGFTLIELLVVMIIIGILAAIAIPVFLSQKDKAKDTSAKSDVNTISKNVQSYFVDGTGVLNVTGPVGGTWTLTPAASGSAVFASGQLSSGNTASGTVTNDSTWCVQVTSGSTAANKYSVSGANGLKNYACTGASNATAPTP